MLWGTQHPSHSQSRNKAAGITGMINCGGPMVVYLTDTLSPFFCQQNHGRGLPWWLSGKEPTCQSRRHGSIHGLGRCICCAVAKPMGHNYWAYAQQLMRPKCPRHHAAQQEKPPQWEAHALQLKSSCNEREPAQQRRPSAAKEKQKKPRRRALDFRDVLGLSSGQWDLVKSTEALWEDILLLHKMWK